MSGDSSRGLIILGVLLAVGLTAGAYVLGTQTKQIGGGRTSISVKGLAEKPVKADLAEWTLGVSVLGPTFADALKNARAATPQLKQFLAAQGFDPASMRDAPEFVTEHFVQQESSRGNMRPVQQGYEANQSVVVTSNDLARVEAAYKNIVQFQADGHPVTYQRPLYLVSNLEDVKMSLIGAATQNAKTRAQEFAKNGNVQVGLMRSASQGSFYVLPDGASTDVDDYGYGGVYDKTTINKKARVVVTIEYAIER
jgi:hypothetical protein